MSSDTPSQDPVITTLAPDPEPTPHDHAEEVAHAWHHFRDNAKFFACFLTVILLTVLAANINFGPRWNLVAVLFFAALRSGLIAYFLASLFKDFSLVFRTLAFTALFLLGMIALSLWDSPVRPIGNPIALPDPPHSAASNASPH